MTTVDRPLLIARHARKRIKEMGLTDDRVRAILAAPEVEYGSDHRNRRAAAGEFVVAYKERGQVIVVLTVTPRVYRPYVRRDVRVDGKLYSELPEEEAD